jgi:selenide,water dikinase
MVELEVPPIRLTELTDCGGCAAKLGADALADALAGLGVGATSSTDPNLEDRSAGLIAGLDPPDDAAVHVVAPGVAVIGTVDFFPPIVDDPRTYGEIAAANALSDVFAMGGRVLFALSVAAVPESMPTEVLRAILEGAASKVREAGGILAGRSTASPSSASRPRIGCSARAAPSPATS